MSRDELSAMAYDAALGKVLDAIEILSPFASLDDVRTILQRAQQDMSAHDPIALEA